MRFLQVLSVFIMLFATAVTVGAQAPEGQRGGAPQAGGPPRKPMVMTLTAFADGSDIPAKYTQAGDETSPGITWTDTPAGTVTFLLSVHDMEGSRNRTTDDTIQWLVWNIPGAETGIPEGIPKGTQLRNGAYQISGAGAVYRGPGAPAAGPRHHYAFELFALDTKVDVQPGTDPYETRTNALKAIQGHILGKAVYMGLFNRPQ
jgi:Raf kinase inhibitor-like YbhB/YbcL family protein